MKNLQKSLTLVVSAWLIQSTNVAMAETARVNVHAATVSLQQYQPSFSTKGRVQAQEDVALQAQVTGYLRSKHFAEGDAVREGQLLFQLDDRQFVANLSLSQAELASAKAQFTLIELDYRRALSLLSGHSISQANVDSLLANKQSAAAAIKGAEAKLDLAKTTLAFTQIKAPFSGKISESNVAIGELISPNTPYLASLVSLSPIDVSFKLSEDDFHHAKLKYQHDLSSLPEASLLLSNGDEFNESGAVTYWGNRVDKQTGTVSLKAEFMNQDKQLIPGQYIELAITDKQSISVLTVPASAVQRDIVGDFVMRVDDSQKALRQNVVVGESLGSQVIIESGVNASDCIINKGLQKIKSGTAVNVAQVCR